MNKKIYLVILCLLVVGGFLVLKSGQKSANQIRVGVIAPLSGSAASIGEKVRNGIEMARLESGFPEKMRFIYEDGSVEPRNALTAYQKLKNVDMADIIIGPFGPDQILSIAPVLGEKDIMLGITLCEDRFRPYLQIFCTYPSIPDQTASGVKVIKDLGIKKLGLIVQNSQLSEIIENELRKSQAEAGYKLEIVEKFNLGDKDFRSLITKVKGAGVDGLYTASLPDEGYILLKQIRDLGFNKPVLAVFDAVEEKLKDLGESAEGVYLPGHISPNFELGFTSRYEDKYKESPDMYGALGHSIVSVLASALKDNDYSMDNLSNKLTNRKSETAIVGFEFRNDRTISIPVESLIFKDGKIRQLENR